MKLVLVGATGAVGGRIFSILEERRFPIDELVPVASASSEGRLLPFGPGEVKVRTLSEEVFEGADIALFDVPDQVSLEWGPVAAGQGAVVVDNSAAFRMDDEVPLIVPEVNPSEMTDLPKGIIASPNCTTLAMVVPMAVLHRAAGLKRLILSSYQAASGSGQPGIDELWEQTQRAAKDPEVIRDGLGRQVLERGNVFSRPLAMNVIPQCGSFREGGYTSEEIKLCDESRKILDLPDLPVTATCVRVPVVVGHGVAVHAEFDKPIDVDEARRLLAGSPGVGLHDDPDHALYPTPLESAGRDACFVGRIRQDRFDPLALELFCVADNLRKGAALNTVQIAELLL